MTNKYKIIISCDGRSFEISPDSQAHLTEGGLRGFDSAGFDVTLTPYASRSGGYAQKRRFAERELSLTFEIDRAADRTLRRQIISMLDPQKDCELYIDIGGVSRTITVIPCDEPLFSRPTFSDLTEATLYFVAPSVFFIGSDTQSLRFHERVGLLTFPMNFMTGSGITPGIYRTYDTGKIVNPGDGECGAVITIKACGGSVKNPRVSSGDEYIMCPLTLDDGDTLAIDTRAGRKNIKYNGERSFIFDKHSSFFSLPVGESVISVTSEDGEEFIDAMVELYPIYYGV